MREAQHLAKAFSHTTHHPPRTIIPPTIYETTSSSSWYAQFCPQPKAQPHALLNPSDYTGSPHSTRLTNLRNTQASTNYKEAFALFDKRGNGRVQLDSLGDLLRACGQNPTLAEISDLEKSVGGDFDFDSFSKVLNRPGGFRDPGEPDEYCRGFQVFDKDLTGYIGVGQLRYSE